MTAKKNFHVLKSSAGSGKTYALVSYYLQLALGSPDPAYYRHILAITFTNAAAAEMKERVIKALTSFKGNNNSSPLFIETAKALQLQPHELQYRAEQCLSHMLHHYGLIAISTIDSFTHKIVRSFARDLRLHPDFSIEMDQTMFNEKIVDTTLDAIGTDPELTEYLERFTLEQFQEESSVKIRGSLEAMSKELHNEDAKPVIELLEKLPLQAYSALRARWKSDIESFENRLIAIAEQAIALADSQGLFVTDFSYGKSGAFNTFIKLSNKNFETPGKRFLADADNRWSSKSTKKDILTKIENIQEELDRKRDEIATIYTSGEFAGYLLKLAALKVAYSMGMLSRLARVAQQIKQEENLILINDFQSIIAEIVNESPAPFIYERVGERFNHILFDEFQDTSGLQWNNFLPLIENSLSKGFFNLLVGDGKQAIYRWRNGKAEQFVRLPEIDKRQLPERKQALRNNYEEGQLKKNYRSAKNIITFNNSFYNKFETEQSLGIVSEVYQQQSQEVHKSLEGYVQIQALENKEKSILRALTLHKIVETVQTCISDGYLPGDIAILTRKGSKEAGPIAAALSTINVDVVTKESFLLSNSSKVKLVMAFMRYLSQPDHLYSRVSIWQQLCILHPEQFNLQHLTLEWSEHHDRMTLPATERFLQHYYPNYTSISILRSAVEIGESIIVLFQLEKDTYLEFLLDHLTRLSMSKELSLKEVVEWWDDNMDKLYISAQEGTDKVNIMTIHKSKGLQFPVVIYPRFASRDHSRNVWLDVNEEEMGIGKILFTHKKTNADENNPPAINEDIEMHTMDQVNLAYVATTRPEERLYMFIEMRDMDVVSKKVIDFLNEKQIQPMHEDSAPFVAQIRNTSKKAIQDSLVYRYDAGVPEKKVQQVIFKTQSISIDGKNITQNSALKMRYTATRERLNETQDKRIFGSLIHECLSHIIVPADIDHAIKKVLPKYPTVSATRIPEIAEHLLKICEAPELRKWFKADSKLYREREIILTDGEIIRPDRFLIEDEACYILDFKTGEPRSSDQQQIDRYCAELSKITGLPAYGKIQYS